MSNFMKIHLSILYVIIILFTNTACWNTTYDFISLKKDSFKTKSERFLSFDTTDDDLKIELEFSVPFLEIPIKKSVNFAKNVVAKVNLPSLVLTGLIVFISAIFLPSIMFIIKKFHITNQFMDTTGSNETYRGYSVDYESDKVLTAEND